MMVLSLDARVPETDRSRARPESARERVARRTSLEPRAGFALARARRRGRASRAALVDASVAPRATRPAAGIVSAIDARARARAFPEGNGQRRPTRFPSVAAPRTTRADLAAIDRRAALDRAPVATVRRRSTECAARAEDPAGARRKSAELNDRGRKERKPPRTARSSGADAPRARRSLAEAIGGRIEIRRESGRRGAGVYSWRIEKSNRRFLSHRRTRGCFCSGCGEIMSERSGSQSVAGRKSDNEETRALNAMAPALGKRPRLWGGGTSGKTCVHGRSWEGYHCRECPGKGICEHGRRRSRCKECGGSQICEHGRERSQCKECGGSSICEHGRVRSQCKECGGGSICEHGRQRSRCKECVRSSRVDARDAKPPIAPKVEIKEEFEYVEDPGEEDYSLQ